MKEIKIADVTLRELAKARGNELTFKEKMDIAEKLDKLCVDVIETAPIANGKSDLIFLHTLAPLVPGRIISCPIGLNPCELEDTWEAIKVAEKKRLNILAPISTVQMEYSFHKKAPVVLGMIEAQVKACRALCDDVELTLVDASRAEKEFMAQVIRTAIAAGAGIVTVCDTAGVMFPSEYTALCDELCAIVPELKDITLSVEYSNALHMAAGCAFSAITAGATQIKTVLGSDDTVNLRSFGQVYRAKSNSFGIGCNLNMTILEDTTDKIDNLIAKKESKEVQFEGAAHPTRQQANFRLSRTDSCETIACAAKEIGYDLTNTELNDVYLAVQRISAKKTETVGPKELMVIVDTVLNQVMPTYRLESFVITSGNVITSSAHVILLRKGERVEGCSFGDGPIDAGFRSIEQITGAHFELDDFQINSVTEGAEAMGTATVKLRSEGKVFSGRGLSTDIVGASIRAYIDALNKIYADRENRK